MLLVLLIEVADIFDFVFAFRKKVFIILFHKRKPCIFGINTEKFAANADSNDLLRWQKYGVAFHNDLGAIESYTAEEMAQYIKAYQKGE